MPTFVDLTGVQCGRWKVIRIDGRDRNGAILWRCRCACGTERTVTGCSLRKGASASCGKCWHAARTRKPPVEIVCPQCGKTFKKARAQYDFWQRTGRTLVCSRVCAGAWSHRNRTTIPTDERFWRHVKKTNTCWLWIGADDGNGYGVFNLDGKAVKAPRMSWALTFGPIPDGLFVLHRCDHPPCVNPQHLFLGTHTDNMKDMVSKGRHGSVTKPANRARGTRNGRHTKPESTRRGEQNGFARLTEQIIRALRIDRTNHGLTYEELMRKYNVRSKAHVRQIIRRIIWKHVA